MHSNTRKSIRWKGYDYAREGAYYITICTDDRRHWFGRIENAIMHRSPIGDLAQRCWNEIPDHMPYVEIGEFIVMPNHVHGIVIIRERMGDDERGRMPVDGDGNAELPVDHDRDTELPVDHDRDAEMPVDNYQTEMPVDHDRPLWRRAMPIVPVGSLGRIVRAYKSAVARIAYRDGLVAHGTKIWQRNYWDRVIRDAAGYARIAKYIRDNPVNWGRDRFNRR